MQPKKYVRKVNQFEAMQWTRENTRGVIDWLVSKGIGYTYHEIYSAGQLVVHGDRQTLQVQDNDYIILFGPGQLDLCSPSLFDKVYEEVDGS